MIKDPLATKDLPEQHHPQSQEERITAQNVLLTGERERERPQKRRNIRDSGEHEREESAGGEYGSSRRRADDRYGRRRRR